MNAAPDAQRQRYVDSCQGLVRSIAWKIHQRMREHVELDELIAYGQLGLMEAAAQYDPSRRVKFVTYAYYRIRGAIFDGLSQMSWFTRRDYHAGTYEHATSDLMAICEMDAADEDSLEADAAWFGRTTQSLGVSILVGDCGFDDRDTGIGDGMSPAASDPSMNASWDEMRRALTSLVDSLAPEPRELLRIVYHENQSLQVAANRLGISRSWASRLHAKTLDELAELLSSRESD